MLQALAFLLVVPYLSLAAKEPICTHGFTLVKNRCLKLFHEPLSHKNAERVCSNFGATLVTIRSSAENLDVVALSNKENNLWIGLFCLEDTLPNCLWDDSLGSAEQYNAFARLSSNIGKCVTVNVTSGSWFSTDCNKEMNSFVCELPTTFEDNCQHNYNGYCYAPHPQKTFEDAQKVCEKECGSLVSIHSENENRYFNTLAGILSPTEYVFIGGMWPMSGSPNWVDGSRWTYNKLDPLHKRENACLVVNGERSNEAHPWGLWYTESCAYQKSFFCKRPAGEICNSGSQTVTVAPVIMSACNSSLLLTPAFIAAPLAPDGGAELGYCSYQVYTLGSNSIMLTFTKFDLYPSGQELKVYDGDSENSRLITTIDYNSYPFSLTSSGNSIFLTFRATQSGSSWKGFEARFTEFYYASPMHKLT